MIHTALLLKLFFLMCGPSLVSFLFDYSINEKDGINGYTVLHQAVLNNQKDLVEVLLEHNAGECL